MFVFEKDEVILCVPLFFCCFWQVHTNGLKYLTWFDRCFASVCIICQKNKWLENEQFDVLGGKGFGEKRGQIEPKTLLQLLKKCDY